MGDSRNQGESGIYHSPIPGFLPENRNRGKSCSFAENYGSNSE